jgi:hypothetical protein
MSLTELQEMYDRALENYRESKSDYDAGIVEGLKRIIEIMEQDPSK